MECLLNIKNLSVDVKVSGNVYRAVDRLSFQVGEGEIYGIAGESGCGKSLTAMSIPKLLPENIIPSGSVLFQGRDLISVSEKDMEHIRGNLISVIYQDPLNALNPLIKIGVQIEEAYTIHNKCKKNISYQKTIEIMERVGLLDPISLYNQYPHNLSGGMKQRAVIAMAAINKPLLLIADEPTTALDVTIQSQILALIRSLTLNGGGSCIFISHDLGVIRQVCDKLSIMYCGQIVESGTVSDVLSNPVHPYTCALLSSLPDGSKEEGRLSTVKGTVTPLNKINYRGCLFYKRCDISRQDCENEPQELANMGKRSVRCRIMTEGFNHA